MKRSVEIAKVVNRPFGQMQIERFVDIIENEWPRSLVKPFEGYLPVRFSMEWHFYRHSEKPLRASRATKLRARIVDCIEKRGFVGDCTLDDGGAVFYTFQVRAQAPRVLLRFWREQ